MVEICRAMSCHTEDTGPDRSRRGIRPCQIQQDNDPCSPAAKSRVPGGHQRVFKTTQTTQQSQNIAFKRSRKKGTSGVSVPLRLRPKPSEKLLLPNYYYDLWAALSSWAIGLLQKTISVRWNSVYKNSNRIRKLIRSLRNNYEYAPNKTESYLFVST